MPFRRSISLFFFSKSSPQEWFGASSAQPKPRLSENPPPNSEP